MRAARWRWPLVCTVGYAAAWAGGAALLGYADRSEAHDPTCRSWVAVCPGDLRRETIWFHVNMTIVALVLWPWSYHAAAWRRAEAAALTTFGLLMVVDVIGQHGGPITTAHVRALLSVAAALAAFAWFSSRVAGRAAPPESVRRVPGAAGGSAPAP